MSDQVNELSIVWPTDYHPSDGQLDPLGLRELYVSTPFGDIVLQYWLCRRVDGGPHAEFVPDSIKRLSLEQKVWLGLRKGRALIDQRLLEEVRREWGGRARPGSDPVGG